MQRDLLRKPLHMLACMGIIFLVSAVWLSIQQWKEVADVNSCKSVYMYPSYARIKSFDESHTQFAAKYSLYMYREQGKDPVPEGTKKGFEVLDGIPVLFVPGNAGSFRQVRSIAAEAANLYYDENIDVVQNDNVRNLDFFAADFNEDFTAFHGRTLLDQAEYLNEAIRFILSLYAHNDNPPKSVLILAHSMGGIVARVLPTLDNYVPQSVNTIVSLSSPHSVPPLTFDGDILSVYSTIDRFWYRAFNDVSFSHYGSLDDVAIISITGGLSDSVLPADYTTLGYLVPPQNGFTVFTTGIPNVWTPMDHLAIVWCRQLRRAVSKALLEVVDFSSPFRVHSLAERMSIFEENFLSGFESDRNGFRHGRDNFTSFKLDIRDVVNSDNHATWRSSEGSLYKRNIQLLSLANATSVSILRGGKKKDHDSLIGVYMCKSQGSADQHVVYTHEHTFSFFELFCVDLASELHPIPRSAKDSKGLDESAFDGEFPPYRALLYDKEQFDGFETLMVVDKRKTFPKSEFTIVSISGNATDITVESSLWSIMMRGADTTVIHDRGLAVNVHFPGAWSSILAYKIRVSEDSGSLFEPFIRQWSSKPYETKWITNLRGEKSFSVSMHGVAPFTPFHTPKEANGLNFQFWADFKETFSKGRCVLEIRVSIDWKNSLKLLAVRFRLAAVSHCLAVTLLVLVFQLRKYSNTGKFPDYYYGLSKLTELQSVIPILVVIYLFTPATRQRVIQKWLNYLDPVNLRIPLSYEAAADPNFKCNTLYLGIEETALAMIGPVFFVMAIGINWFISILLTSLGRLLVGIMTFASSCVTKKASIKDKAAGEESSIPKTKLMASALLLLLVPLYLPYQFAYLVCFVIQIFSCVKILHNKASRSWWNYNFSILMAMLWILPINVPIVIVFIHNFNLSWATPFSSHHNFLAVAPILMLIELHNFYGDEIPLGFQTKDKQPRLHIFKVTISILLYTIVYSLLYGVRHAFWLHHLFNFWCSWLVILSISQNFGNEAQSIKA